MEALGSRGARPSRRSTLEALGQLGEIHEQGRQIVRVHLGEGAVELGLEHFARRGQTTHPMLPQELDDLDWNPFTNQVSCAPESTVEPRAAGAAALPPVTVSDAPEPDTRYAHLLACFRAVRAADPFSSQVPTQIARRLDLEREIPAPGPEAKRYHVPNELWPAFEIAGARVASGLATEIGRNMSQA